MAATSSTRSATNMMHSTVGLSGGVGDQREFSDILWNLIFSATGFKKIDVEMMRERNEQESRTPDVCDFVAGDSKWTDERLIKDLRTDLQQYVDVLRSLKEENFRRAQRSVKVKSFVEDKRYTMLREREASLRVTTKSIEDRFRTIDFSKRKIVSLDRDITALANVDELDMRQNQLTSLDFIPPNARVVMASSNIISSVSEEAMASNSSLLYLGLSCNVMQDISFVKASPSLAFLDLSYNGLSDINHVIEVLHNHPTLRECVFVGNPIALARNYRKLIARSTPLTRLDDIDITEADRTGELQVPPPPPEEPKKVGSEPPSTTDTPRNPEPPVAQPEAPTTTFDFSLRLTELHGAASIIPAAAEEPTAASPAKGGGKAPAKDKKGDPKAPVASALPQKRFALSVESDWQGIQISSAPLETQPPPPAEDAAPAKGGKGKKPAAESTQVSDVLTLGIKEDRVIDIEPASVWSLQKPMVVRLIVTETTNDEQFELGKFVVDLSSIVDAVTEASTVQTTANLMVSKNTIEDMRLSITHQEEQLHEMVVADTQLDRELLTVSTPIQPKDEVVPKKGGGAAKAAKPQVSEEEIKLQNESAARKVEIEEFQQKLQYEKRTLSKLQSASLSLVIEAVLNPSYIYPVKETPRVEVDPKKDKKKK